MWVGWLVISLAISFGLGVMKRIWTYLAAGMEIASREPRWRYHVLCQGASTQQLKIVMGTYLPRVILAASVYLDEYGHYKLAHLMRLHRVRRASCGRQQRIYDSLDREFLEPVRYLTQDEARDIHL